MNETINIPVNLFYSLVLCSITLLVMCVINLVRSFTDEN